MKVFNVEAMNKQSWSIALEYDQDEAVIKAVDSIDGDTIAVLISFMPDGRVVIEEGAADVIRDEGYDVEEHGNQFDYDGRLIVSTS